VSAGHAGARSDRLAWVALAALTACAAALRATNLGLRSLWYDEAVIWNLVQGGWREIVTLNMTMNSAPPLYPVLLGMLTGPADAEWQLRLLSCVAGIAGVPLTWLLAREWVGPRYALLAALLVALAPTQVVYAQQLREYSLAYALSAALALAATRFMAVPGTARGLALGAVLFVGLLTQHGLALVAAGCNVACLLALRAERRPLRDWVAWAAPQAVAAAIALALCLPTLRSQFGLVTEYASGPWGYLADRHCDGTLDGLRVLLLSPRADIVSWAFPGKVMLALAVAGGLGLLVDPDRRRAGLLLLAPGVVVLACALVRAYPFGGVRQDIVLLPMVYVAAANGLRLAVAALAGRWPRRPASAPALVAAAVTLALVARAAPDVRTDLTRLWPEHLRPVVAALRDRAAPGDGIYAYFGAIPAFRYYWRDDARPWQAGAEHWSGVIDPARTAPQLERVRQEIAALAASHGRAWVVVSHLSADDLALLAAPYETGALPVLAAGDDGAWLYRVDAPGGKGAP